MSGGVDSSVAAHLLLQAGYAVEGLFMKNWEEEEQTHCLAAQDLSDAQQVCDRLGIKLHTINFASEYWDNVFEHFLQEYAKGRTPNPDILCNREIKFKVFLEHALNLGADYIATGHYAKIERTAYGLSLKKAKDLNKEQTYFLYTLGQQQLAKTIFPLAEYNKATVRTIAQQLGFINCAKKDSTGICFIGERNFRKFLQNYLPTSKGPIITANADLVGEHEGLLYYTLGQRQGLNIGGIKNASPAPWYVIEKRMATNTLVVSQQRDDAKLYNHALRASELTLVLPLTAAHLKCKAKIRYRQLDSECEVALDLTKRTCKVTFTQAQRAITPGQSIVLYQADECLGGAIIEEAV